MKIRSLTMALGAFALAAASFVANAQSFSNAAPITISASETATPYPSEIAVSGITGNVEAVTVTLTGLTYPESHDLDVLLVGPGGQQVVLMSQAGWQYPGPSDVTLTFSAVAAQALGHDMAVTSGTWLPSDHDGVDTFPAPAPANTGNTDLTVFNGPATNANGSWRLFVRNNPIWGPQTGSIAGGWTLNITAGEPEPTTTCASEGYTGTKLTWCKNICEKGLTGAALDTWIHRWVSKYRDLPYCAAEEEELPPQEG